MITESKLTNNIDILKEGVGILLKQVEESIVSEDWDEAIEQIAILNANVVGIIICDDMLNQ